MKTTQGLLWGTKLKKRKQEKVYINDDLTKKTKTNQNMCIRAQKKKNKEEKQY